MNRSRSFPETQSIKGDFPETHWSAVLTAGNEESPKALAALERICQNYWFPLYAFLRRKGYAYAEAQDMTQQFLVQLMEKNSIRLAQRERGKFRSFLLTSLNHFLTDEWRRQTAQKRGGGQVVSLSGFSDAETRFQSEPYHEVSPDHIFDKAWALTLLEKTMARLRQVWEEDGKQALFDRLKGYILAAAQSPPYRELAAECQMTEGALKMTICRLRRFFREVLCDEIAQTVERPEEIEEEIQYFIKVLTATESEPT
jgi:RNA polymerase sigma-70 factor (ECF subfamily)